MCIRDSLLIVICIKVYSPGGAKDKLPIVPAVAPDSTPALVGYKGPGEVDAAAFYCPYIPLMSSGVVMDPNTFEPTVSFMTRYGYKELTNTANSFGNAGDYVSKVAVSNLAFTQA